MHFSCDTRKVLVSLDLRLFGDLVILKIYELYPLRNDFHDMRVVNHNDIKDNDNRLIINGSYMTLALNEYKTSKKYGEKLIQVDKKLTKLIADYLKVQTTGYLLIDEKKMEPLSSHGITKRLHRITKSRIGKAIGSSMIESC